MMKYLHILRHAKSSWDYLGIDDIDRPLIEKGIHNAYMTASYFHEEFGKADKILSSPANRAIHTSIIFARQTETPINSLFIDNRLYETDSSTIIDVVEETSSDINHLVVVGHNPVFTELANLFLSEYIPNIPTSGLVSLFFDVKEWAIVDKVPVDHKIYMPKKG